MFNVKETSTPELVREFSDLHVASATSMTFDFARHQRLGDVVDELRSRGVLD